jgi:integrase
MSDRYKLVQLGNRGGMFYYKDTQSGARKSLKTKDRKAAEKAVFHMNEAAANPHASRRIGLAYLSVADPELTTRTWKHVMADIIKDKQGPNLRRYEIAFKDEAYHVIADKILVDTQPPDFKAVLRAGTVSTNVYLRRLQNHAVDMGWLPLPVLPKKKFDKIKHKEMRAITWEEHCRIIERERNQERRDFYELCWHFGGSQTDIASLYAEDVDYENRSFWYARRKTGNLAGTRIGPKAWEVIQRLPRSGPFFPYLITVREADRATEFKQRCKGLGIKGVTLHSYRYAWAERSADSGYPERYAQRALGQNSKMVHRAYARKAQGQLPSLEAYEEAMNNGKIVVLRQEAGTPALLGTSTILPPNTSQTSLNSCPG